MADNVELDPASGGATIRTKDKTTYETPVSLIDVGGAGAEALVGDAGNYMPVEGAASENAAAAGNPVLVGVRYDLTPRTLGDGDVGAPAADPDGAIHISDGGNSITVDGTVTVTATALDVRALTNADVVTAELSATDNAVLDQIELNTDFGVVVGGGAEATALRVTVANDSTGVLTVDGAAAENAAAAGNPVLIGGRYDASARTLGDGDVGAPAVNVSGELIVDEPNVISSVNSTTATLGISGTFIPANGDDISNFSAVTIQIDSSHDSAASGMTFEFSSDDTNWDDVYTYTYTAADGSRRFQFPATAQYFRVNYTNGGTGQTHFRLQTILHRHPVTGSVHRVADSVDPDRSSSLTKSVIVAQSAGSGDFVPVQASAAGNFKIALEEYDGVPTGGGTEAGSLRVTVASDTTGVLSIDDNGASITVDGTITASNTAGDVAHDTADSGNPVKIGAKIEATTSDLTLPADGDRTDASADRDGTLQVRVNHPFGDILHGRDSETTTTENVMLNFGAQGADIRNYITGIAITNSSATDIYVDFRDGSAGTIVWTVPVPANGGAVCMNGGHPLFRTTANTALYFQLSGAATTVYVSVTGFKSKV